MPKPRKKRIIKQCQREGCNNTLEDYVNGKKKYCCPECSWIANNKNSRKSLSWIFKN